MPAFLISKSLARGTLIFYCDSVPVTPEGNISSSETPLCSIATLVSLLVSYGVQVKQTGATSSVTCTFLTLQAPKEYLYIYIEI